MVILNNMNKKTGQGRKKIKIKKIEENNNRQITFSKRRNRLFKKAAELCVLTGAKIAIIVKSPGGRIFTFGHPNVDALIDTYLGNEKNLDVDVDMDRWASQTNDFNKHYTEVQHELELEKKHKDVILEKTRSEFWFDEPIDGMDVGELEEYLSSLQELKRKVLNRAAELRMINNAPAFFGLNLNNNTPIPDVLPGVQGHGPNVMHGLNGPNELQHLQGHGPNVTQECSETKVVLTINLHKDVILEKTRSEFWFDEPIDGMDVGELEEYLSSLQELKRKVLNRADELRMINNAPAFFGSNLNNNTPIQDVLQGVQGHGPNVTQECSESKVVLTIILAPRASR
nr:agamous-like MADS-box protein AGL62 [Tanacetum cinerariifolium]